MSIGSLVLMKLMPMSLLGTSVWWKPFKFFISTTIFVWSMGWYSYYLGPHQSIVWYSWGLIILFTIEDLYIFTQAAQGSTSHFNMSTPFYAKMWSIMALSAVGISVWTAIIGVKFFTQDLSALPEAYLWSIRLALIIFVIFSLEGLVMGAKMAHTVGAPDGTPGLPVVNWSKTHGDLRVAHFMGMHALQVLPLLSFYILKDLRLTIVVCVFYAAINVFLFVLALQGKPLIRWS
jgi:hypothetical protein